ncbi:MAG: hypothetical protein KDB57_04295 [Solirubrobacterales bacterium]|nr:hypothetical protein [Solirubrobacterales bacterium]
MSLAPERDKPLSFELEATESGGSERIGIRLTEAGSSSGHRLQIRLGSSPTERISNSLTNALRESKIKPGQLSPRRKAPLALVEEAGVRLALVMVATKPVSLRRRVTEIEEGIAAMSTEETYYWYSKCTGAERNRSQRALRLLVSGE